jgi:hypothetical protein
MSMQTSTDKPVTRTFIVADVKCYLCGAVSGSVESERQPIPRSVMFKKNQAATAMPILDWHQLRCERCEGPVFLDDAEVVTRRFETYNWMEDRPRRGRPPKRLLEERRRERERPEQQRAA